jgi:hypothetical protein
MGARLAAAILLALLAGCAPTTPTPDRSQAATPPTSSAATSPGPLPTPVACPDEVNLATVSGLDPAGRLSCLGDQTLTFKGTFGCGGCGGVDTQVSSPEWLTAMEFHYIHEPTSVDAGRLALHFPPDLTPPEEDSFVEVVGHFDDPRASECRIAWLNIEDPDASPIPIPVAEAIQYCRERFVVESFELLSVEEIPPPG